MRTTQFFIFFFFSVGIFYNVGYAQNLVPDPGFELHNEDCSGSVPLISWFSPNTATPDLWSVLECGNTLTEELMAEAGVPFPFEGHSYAGLFCCYSENAESQTREYLTSELLVQLEAGQQYAVSFNLSRRTSRDIAIDKIGVYFSEEAPFDEGYQIMDVEPQLETSGELLTPDLVWQQIEFVYLADGSENFITIGNFRDLDEMMWEILIDNPNNPNSAYYLFDNIVVEALVNDVANSESDFRQTVFNSSTFLLKSVPEANYFLYSTEGKIVLFGSLINDEIILPIDQLDAGIYVLAVEFQGDFKSYKFVKIE